MDRMLRAGEVCQMIGIHKVTLYRWIHTGILPATRLPSGEYRIAESDIDLLLRHGRLTAKKIKPRRMPEKPS